MYKLLFIVWYVCFSCTHALGSAEQIFELYTEARGNNPYEAKIKAIDAASKRAFLLLADKFSIKDKNFNNIPAQELNNIFADIEIKNEKEKNQGINILYSATLDVTFLHSQINYLFLKHGSNNTKNRFYEALIIPLLKINNRYIINSDQNWLNLWKNSREKLLDNMLLYPYFDNDKIKYKFSPHKIMKYNFEDFLINSPETLYKKVILVVGEYFTERSTGASYLNVKNITISNDHNNIIENKKYELPPSIEGMNNKIEKIIDSYIKKYGRKMPKFIVKERTQQALKDNKSDEESKFNKYNFFLTSGYTGEFKTIYDKLTKIKEIKDFSINESDNNRIEIILSTKMDILEMARKLYYNNISFYYNNSNEREIININGN